MKQWLSNACNWTTRRCFALVAGALALCALGLGMGLASFVSLPPVYVWPSGTWNWSAAPYWAGIFILGAWANRKCNRWAAKMDADARKLNPDRAEFWANDNLAKLMGLAVKMVLDKAGDGMANSKDKVTAKRLGVKALNDWPEILARPGMKARLIGLAERDVLENCRNPNRPPTEYRVWQAALLALDGQGTADPARANTLFKDKHALGHSYKIYAEWIAVALKQAYKAGYPPELRGAAAQHYYFMGEMLRLSGGHGFPSADLAAFKQLGVEANAKLDTLITDLPAQQAARKAMQAGIDAVTVALNALSNQVAVVSQQVDELGRTVLQGNSESLQRDDKLLKIIEKLEARFPPIGVDAAPQLPSDAETILLNAAKPYADALTAARIAIVQGDSVSASRLVPLAVEALKGFTAAVRFEQSRLLGDAAFLTGQYDTALAQYRVAKQLRSDDLNTNWRMFVVIMNMIAIAHKEFRDRVFSDANDSEDEGSNIKEHTIDSEWVLDDMIDEIDEAHDAIDKWIEVFAMEHSQLASAAAPDRVHSAIRSLQTLARECSCARFMHHDAINFHASSKYEREYKDIIERLARKSLLQVGGLEWAEDAYWLLQVMFGDEEDVTSALYFALRQNKTDTEGHRRIAVSAAAARERCGRIGEGWKAALTKVARCKGRGTVPNREVKEIFEKSGCAELLHPVRE